MGKQNKQNKQKAKGDESPRLLSAKALEEKTAVDLEQGNYRRAKEWLKELSKRNKELYQPALVDCYQKLAAQMLEKGQRSEAKTVFDQIKMLTGRSVDGLLEAQSLTMGDDYPAAAAAMVGRLGDLHQKPLSGEEKRRLADALVVAFDEIPNLRERHPEIDRELTSIRAALEHLSAGRFSDAQGEVKAIGRSSIFSAWRLFVKGMCAFYSNDDAKAREALLHLDDDSLLFRAARPFIHIIDDGTTPLPKDEAKEPLLMDVCRALNRPEFEHALPRAEYLWRTGRHADSLEHLLRTVGDFPTLDKGLLRSLSLFYFNIAFQMKSDSGEKYIRDLNKVTKRIPGRHVAALLSTRATVLFLERSPFLPDDELVKLWERFLFAHGLSAGENNRLRALVYAHMGDMFAEELDGEPQALWCGRRNGRKIDLRNIDLAQEAYEKSLALAQDDRDVHLKLMKLYEKSGDHAARNRKLDEITRLFPDDKDVLFQNGNNCIERKAYVKGIEYLRRALSLDPLSRTNRETLVNALIKASLHFARQNKIIRSREWMKEALELAGDADASDMTMGRPSLLIRMAIFEWMCGGHEEGDRRFAEALQYNNKEGWLSYFAFMIGDVYRLPKETMARLEKDARKVVSNFSPTGVVAAIEVIRYIKLIAPQTVWLARERERIEKRALKVADQPCTEEEAGRIVADALEQSWKNHDLIERYVKIGLNRDPKSPLFLYFQFLDEQSSNYLHSPTAKDVKKLEEIKVIALKRNDRLLVNTLDRDIRRIEMAISSFDMGAYADEYDYDDEEDDDDSPLDFQKLAREFIEEMETHIGSRGKPSRSRKNKRVHDVQASLFDDPEIPF
jgi:tetratricopeptide (TPR) repeat protein